MNRGNFMFAVLSSIGIFTLPCFASRDDYSRQEIRPLCNTTGMTVFIDLDSKFAGTVYPEGTYDNLLCRYDVYEGDQNETLAFFFPTDDCGTIIEKIGNCIYMKNIIVIQENRVIETSSDVKQGVSCRFAVPEIEEFGNIFSYATRSNPFEMNEIKSWMEFNVGSDISSAKVPNIVRLGDEFLLVIHLKDNGMNKDLRVSSCWAHDNETIENSEYMSPLFDTFSCRPSIWMSEFNVTDGVKNISDKIIYSKFKSFKYPSTIHFQVTCRIEVCQNACFSYCNQPEANGNNQSVYLNNIQKRSISINYSDKSLHERAKLMKSKLKALRVMLANSRKKRSRSVNNADFLKRKANATTAGFPDGNERHVRIFPIGKNSAYAYEIVTPAADGNSESTSGFERYRSIMTESYSEAIWNVTYRYNLSTAVWVLSTQPESEKRTVENSQVGSLCMSRADFKLVAIIMSVVVSLLIVICIVLCCYLHKEKKKRLLDNFMLYNFY